MNEVFHPKLSISGTSPFDYCEQAPSRSTHRAGTYAKCSQPGDSPSATGSAAAEFPTESIAKRRLKRRRTASITRPPEDLQQPQALEHATT